MYPLPTPCMNDKIYIGTKRIPIILHSIPEEETNFHEIIQIYRIMHKMLTLYNIFN